MHSFVDRAIGRALTALGIVALVLTGLSAAASAQQFTDEFTLPDVVAPTGCRVGGVVSEEQFTTTGYSNVKLGGPNATHVAGAWVVADDFVETTSVTGGRDCDGDGDATDAHDLNLMGVRLIPTITSAKKADIEQVKLVQDVNLNGQYEPLLDQVLQTRDGSTLDSQNSAVFQYGPNAPLAQLGTVAADCTTIVEAGESIQDAIDSAGAGATICVEPGTYTETLDIDVDGLTLLSLGVASETIIEADLANTGNSPKLIVVDDAKNVTIDGFTLRDANSGTTANGTVHAVQVLATSGGDDASGFTLTNSVVEDLNAQDRVRALAVNVVQGGSGGPSAGTADNPTITDNVFRNLVVDGDALANDPSGESGNRVVGTGLNGSVSGAEVSNNTFDDFRISPRSTGNNKCIIHAVELSEDSNGDGPTGFSITDNTFDNFVSCENTVNNEDVSSIAIFVGGLNSLGNHEISRNNFNFDVGSAPTLGAGVDTLASEEVDATDNWWGASDGPSTRSGISPGRMANVSGANGSGVLVSDGVDFSNSAASAFSNIGAPAVNVGCSVETLDRIACAIGLLAVVEIGDSPKTGAQFGLQLEAIAGNLPGKPRTNNIAGAEISSGFASSLNPQASNVRLQLVGGEPSSETPLTHISNGSGSPEANVERITFTGGEADEGLLSRFRVEEVNPGTREAVAIAAGVCDAASLSNTSASILPQIAGAAPSIAGGLDSLTCVNSDGGDAFLTGLNGATLIFDGDQAEHMGTVRMYVDSDADGVLFEPGELVQQVTPIANESTGEAIAVFGGNQGQILSDGNGNPIAGGALAGTGIGQIGGNQAGTPADAPLLVVFTVDVNDGAASGDVDVKLGLQSYDSTAFARDVCASAPAGASSFAADGSCGSNFANDGPATATISIAGEGNGDSSATPEMARFDANGNGVIDDGEFTSAVNDWVAGSIDDALFFDVLDAWVDQTSLSGSNVSSLRLTGVSLRSETGGTTFAASGQAIENTSVDVFSLDGTTVFSAESAGNTLSWNHTASNGQPVANGVYLYRVTVEGANGETVTSEVKKLTVIR